MQPQLLALVIDSNIRSDTWIRSEERGERKSQDVLLKNVRRGEIQQNKTPAVYRGLPPSASPSDEFNIIDKPPGTFGLCWPVTVRAAISLIWFDGVLQSD